MQSNRLIAAFSVILIATLACNMPGTQVTGGPDLPGTITAQALTLQAPSSTPGVPTDTPTVTPTTTPSVPQVTVSSATNCRTGPSTAYDLLYTMNPGQVAEVVGKNTPTNYWIIKYPNGTCWLWGQYATVSGNISGLPEYPPPPTPTPSEPAAPKNFKATSSCSPSGQLFTSNIHVNLTWTDLATNEEGYHIYRGNTMLATLGANATSYRDDTTITFLLILGTTPP